jgi:[ribosomal protein S5]-alanine N-acetyltransferase
MMRDEDCPGIAEFTTERLFIRPITSEDAEALFLIKSDPQVTTLYGQSPHRGPEETRSWVLRCIADRSTEMAFTWAITLAPERKVIGECCLWNMDHANRCAELGYELQSAFWGKGLMAEALAPVLEFTFIGLGLHRVEALPLATNRSSITVLKKMGFVQEGVYRQRVLWGQKYVDQLVFSLLEADWKEHANHKGEGPVK